MIEYREEILDHPIEMAALKYLAAEGWELVLGELVQQPLPWSRRYLFKRQVSADHGPFERWLSSAHSPP